MFLLLTILLTPLLDNATTRTNQSCCCSLCNGYLLLHTNCCGWAQAQHARARPGGDVHALRLRLLELTREAAEERERLQAQAADEAAQLAELEEAMREEVPTRPPIPLL